MKKITLPLLLLFLFATSPLAVAATTIYQSTKKSSQEPGKAHTYRIPALLVTQKGTLLAFAEARRNAGGDTCDIDTVVRRSTDGGKTWGPEIIAFAEGGNVAGNPCPVVDQKTGRILLLTTWNSSKVHEKKIVPGFGKDSRRVFCIYSDDDGKSWSKPKEITRQAKKENWGWYATGPGSAIQLTRGNHQGRIIIPCDHKAKVKDTWTYCSHILYSDDAGENWKIGAISSDGLNECEAVELENGDIMLNSRNHRGQKNMTTRGVSISRDGGETFDAKAFHHNEALVEPHCQASIRRLRWKEGAKPGVIVFSNPASKDSRIKMTVRASYDDGKTWPFAKEIYAGGSAYSDLAALPCGKVGLLYEKDRYKTIEFVTLEVE